LVIRLRTFEKGFQKWLWRVLTAIDDPVEFASR